MSTSVKIRVPLFEEVSEDVLVTNTYDLSAWKEDIESDRKATLSKVGEVFIGLFSEG